MEALAALLDVGLGGNSFSDYRAMYPRLIIRWGSGMLQYNELHVT